MRSPSKNHRRKLIGLGPMALLVLVLHSASYYGSKGDWSTSHTLCLVGAVISLLSIIWYRKSYVRSFFLLFLAGSIAGSLQVNDLPTIAEIVFVIGMIIGLIDYYRGLDGKDAKVEQ